MLFVAPTLAGTGPRWLGELPEPLTLLSPTTEQVEDDVLITAYLRKP